MTAICPFTDSNLSATNNTEVIKIWVVKVHLLGFQWFVGELILILYNLLVKFMQTSVGCLILLWIKTFLPTSGDVSYWPT